MWISNEAWLENQKQFITVVAERDAIKQQQTAIVNTNEWLMHRVTQLEHERAVMIYQHYGVKVAAPVIEKVPDTVGKLDLNETLSFNDMGDDAALKAGIGWNEDGGLTYGQKN